MQQETRYFKYKTLPIMRAELFTTIVDGYIAYLESSKQLFKWNASSTATDDGVNTIKINSYATGRWIKTTPILGTMFTWNLICSSTATDKSITITCKARQFRFITATSIPTTNTLLGTLLNKNDSIVITLKANESVYAWGSPGYISIVTPNT